MSSSLSANSPCAACKFLRRKCQPDCVFAPYFPPDNPQKFLHVHRVFGACNVTKILNDLYPLQREDAVNSLAYEANWRLRDPIHGCVGVISILQHQLRQLQIDLSCAKNELSKYQAKYRAAAEAAGLSSITTTTFIGGAGISVDHGLFNPNNRLMGIGGGGGGGGLRHDYTLPVMSALDGNNQQQQQHHLHHLISSAADAGYATGFESKQMNITAAAGRQWPQGSDGDERPGIGSL